MSLKQFIAEQNRVAGFFNEPQIDINKITDEQAQKMFSRLDSNMSPEHLHMDGERSAAQARKFAKIYTDAFNELKAKGFTPRCKLYMFA